MVATEPTKEEIASLYIEMLRQAHDELQFHLLTAMTSRTGDGFRISPPLIEARCPSCADTKRDVPGDLVGIAYFGPAVVALNERTRNRSQGGKQDRWSPCVTDSIHCRHRHELDTSPFGLAQARELFEETKSKVLYLVPV